MSRARLHCWGETDGRSVVSAAREHVYTAGVYSS